MQAVSNAVLSVLYNITRSAISILALGFTFRLSLTFLNTIDIPSALFLDLFTWIGTYTFTIMYKAVEGYSHFSNKYSSIKTIVFASR